MPPPAAPRVFFGGFTWQRPALPFQLIHLPPLRPLLRFIENIFESIFMLQQCRYTRKARRRGQRVSWRSGIRMSSLGSIRPTNIQELIFISSSCTIHLTYLQAFSRIRIPTTAQIPIHRQNYPRRRLSCKTPFTTLVLPIAAHHPHLMDRHRVAHLAP